MIVKIKKHENQPPSALPRIRKMIEAIKTCQIGII